jgi:hypothetical protein
MRKPRRSGRGAAVERGESSAHSSGTRPNQAKTVRQTGSGPARGNGNSSRAAERTAAAHSFQARNFQAPNFQNARGILRRVYRIRSNGANSRTPRTACR